MIILGSVLTTFEESCIFRFNIPIYVASDGEVVDVLGECIRWNCGIRLVFESPTEF